MKEPPRVSGSSGPALRLLAGRWTSQAFLTALRLGVLAALAHNPLPADELARRSGLHARSLSRLLQALSRLGMVRQCAGRWSASRAGAAIAADRAWTDLAALVPTAQYDAVLRSLEYTVRTGGSALEHAVETPPARTFTPPPFCDSFAAAHAALTQLLYSCVADAYSLTPRACLIDISATIPPASAATDDGTVIPAGSDCYVLLGGLPYLSDHHAVRLLKNVRAHMDASGVLLIGEVIDRGAQTCELTLLIDVHMMLISPLARLRTLPELRALLCAADFNVEPPLSLASGASLLVAHPVTSSTVTAPSRRRKTPCVH